ncbi:DUF1835 domain-containing protein [Mangrovimonas sp. AS39]|uniref:hypothetical protein n=1 Tax=Mangrovimonas TaxID=1211036 RepID=UPI0006B50F34|nr:MULTISPECIES: hypothetical protein [Mangrovimonas]MCF1191766.1 DUF1835 domain-containing protein [Mangrovimonas futianensis]MCF1195346.1 DUF1835 domain-containing protein [Mangrovimonas futianensis]
METLHITNGSVLTQKLLELEVQGDYLTWDEMLCEGPTTEKIDSKEFLELRSDFFNKFYNLELDKDKFHEDINKLSHTENYSEIVLWFEYDLFCHINMLAAINVIRQKKIKLPLYLVCSGRIEGEDNLKGLGELNASQLLKHYKNKVKLTENDMEVASTLWKTYCGKDHNLFKPYIIKNDTNFQYLTNCLKAHLQRFPESKSGLSIIEENILVIIRDNEVKSRHHLLGYILNYQGYYGYGDLQFHRIIENLKIFFDETETRIKLNRKGHVALLRQTNFSSEVNNNIDYGGVNRLDFQFSTKENKLIKTPINAY